MRASDRLRTYHPVVSCEQLARLCHLVVVTAVCFVASWPIEASGARVAIADPALAASIERALFDAASCRAVVGRAFGVRLAGDETWLAGDRVACKASGATSYIRRSVPGTAYACPPLASASAAERTVYGKDPAQGMNAAIIRACWQGRRADR